MKGSAEPIEIISSTFKYVFLTMEGFKLTSLFAIGFLVVAYILEFLYKNFKVTVKEE
ncbi:hypothetical protein M0G43_11490 [Subsaxibacter sp. CAU 1640]|uniref:hypothetical protein n=1 Tax=Subsaxibacter sp. CAU 1640 TaxID=2933271 RepID=UPI00200312F5|nr:hypothetical protein [Subsaxibacter sp. CAU 1640]MCK7591200.1 hypothetical protein [Subsaxibacter sp. CAU 1640]